MPEIQARPELVEFLRQDLPHRVPSANNIMQEIEKWLPRKIIDWAPTDRIFSHIAEELAREHDPDFPAFDFDSPLAKCSTSGRREGSSSTKELIQDGRGWRYYHTVYDSGPAEVVTTREKTATAIHPEWTLTVHANVTTGRATEFWNSLQTWEPVPQAEEDIVARAEIMIKSGFGRGVKKGWGRIRSGKKVNPDDCVRLIRDGHVRWQGQFVQFTLKPSGRCSLELDVSFDIEAGDTLECFSK